MKLSDFAYDLPEDLIAQAPLKKRDHARLMVIERKSGRISHDYFYNLRKYLPPKSLVVLNDSKVIPARLLGRKKSTGGAVEIFILNKLEGNLYHTMLRPLRRLHNGDIVEFDKSSLTAEIIDWQKRLVRFNRADISTALKKIGHMPLPPYIRRPDKYSDRKDYQTVYAKTDGSVAAPTAGLHFTGPLIKQLKKDGHAIDRVTLHVNAATFQGVKTQDITQHPMHSEEYALKAATRKNIAKTIKEKRPIVAIGTTSCRVLETVANSGILNGATNIFIYPGYRFKSVDVLVTNFHLPYSTLLMLVYAFGGKDLMTKAYQEAIKEKYRFFSYGDAMIIL